MYHLYIKGGKGDSWINANGKPIFRLEEKSIAGGVEVALQ